MVEEVRERGGVVIWERIEFMAEMFVIGSAPWRRTVDS